MRFEHIDVERREQFVKAQHELRQIQDDRRNLEIKASAEARASGGQPVRMNVHTSATTTRGDDQRGRARRNRPNHYRLGSSGIRPDECSRRIRPADRHGNIPQAGHSGQGS